MTILSTLDWEFALHGLRVASVAGLLTGILGLEREIARKPAGLRTHMLVGIAAAAFMLLGQKAVGEYAEGHSANLLESDPVRVIQSIVLGISVLGAGTILHDGGQVEGLTTAASLLLAAAIGIAVANEQPLFAAAIAGLVAAILFVVGRLEQWREGGNPPRRADTR